MRGITACQTTARPPRILGGFSCLAMSSLLLPALSTAMLSGAAPAAAQEADTTGTGWTITRQDLDVRIEPEQGRIELVADMVLRLTSHERSNRLTLVMNSRDTIMHFDSVTADRGRVAALNQPIPVRPSVRGVVIDLSDADVARGAEVRVQVRASSLKSIPQFTLAEDVALASWVTLWYPVPLPGQDQALSAVVKAPGWSRFDLPPGWRVVSNGVRRESEERNGRVLEGWETSIPLARSFAAAPYRVYPAEAGGRSVELFLLTVQEEDARVQANALAGAISALEKRFGPYPTGGYAIAEVPSWVPGFLAASEQGFMMAKAENFAVPGGNIPLFAHEAAHGYWGNLLSSTGPGAGFLSESIAQYGAVIALEEMVGEESAVEFLKFSRAGYIPYQSAAGFFEVVRRGNDSMAISEMESLNGMAARIVADSKGTWIYHMLRDLVGDERFFATLREYLVRGSDGSSTLDAFRETFIRAAPEVDVEAFFEQWLDRTGAPRFDVSWTMEDGEAVVVIEQVHEGEPYTLDLDLRLEGADGAASLHEVRVTSARTTVRLPAEQDVASIIVDPAFRVLRWDRSYQGALEGHD